MDRYVDYVPLDQVRLAPRNPKGHHGDGIRSSIGHFGFAELPLIDERTGRLVAGHGRHEQLVAMHSAGHTAPDGIRVTDDGVWCMPVIRGWSSRSDADAEAYLVGSNQWTIAGGWNNNDLAEVLASVADADLLELTGFTTDDLTNLLADASHTEEVPAAVTDPDHIPEVPPDPVTKPGDLWLLGPHRVVCGDCRDYDTVTRLLDGAQINLAFTSPPYASQRKYDETSGFRPIPPDDYVDWFEDVQANVRVHLAEDGSWFVNIKEHTENGQRHLYVKDLTLAHVRRWAWRFVDELCWFDTSNGFPGAFPNRFKDAWEPVFHFSQQQKIKFDPVANGRPSDDVFRYDPQSRMHLSDAGYQVGVKPTYEPGLARPSNVIQIPAGGGRGGHSAAFPVQLPTWFIRAYTDPQDAVFDPFLGSGTTLIAAHQAQRIGYGSEISPRYVDVICRRWQEHTGTVPVLAATGEPHDFTQ